MGIAPAAVHEDHIPGSQGMVLPFPAEPALPLLHNEAEIGAQVLAAAGMGTESLKGAHLLQMHQALPGKGRGRIEDALGFHALLFHGDGTSF
jgi:hypothetical protein